MSRIITAKEKAIAELAAQPKHQLTIFEINDQLNIALENEHKRILNGILANSELEFEGEEGTEYIPTLAQIQEKSKETKEEVFIQHEVVTKKREEREALNCQLEEKTREIARLKEEYEKNKAELEQTKKNNKDRAAKVFFKMHKNNPVGSKLKCTPPILVLNSDICFSLLDSISWQWQLHHRGSRWQGEFSDGTK